jgi:hypothetical protein
MEKVSDGITKMCKEPENARLTVIQVQVLVTLKFRGETDEYINTVAQKYRKIAADSDQPK